MADRTEYWKKYYQEHKEEKKAKRCQVILEEVKKSVKCAIDNNPYITQAYREKLAHSILNSSK